MQTFFFKYIFPRVAKKDIAAMLGFALLGAVIAGFYGVIHDLVTFSIGPEYFTKLKFIQFHYLNFDWGDRPFACCIGFMASWWVGLIAGWFLARKFVPEQSKEKSRRTVFRGFAIVFVSGLLGAIAGYGYGLWRGPDADYSVWESTFAQLGIGDKWSFLRVAYIHNGSYAGGLVGLIIALLRTVDRKSEPL